MVAIAGTWVSYTSGSILRSSDLNNNFAFVTAMVNKGITGANIATGGIDAGALIAASIITHGNMSFAANGGLKCIQIGKSTVKGGQLMLKGSCVVAINTLTNTDTTIYFNSGDSWVAGDVYPTTAPHFYVNCVYLTPTTAPTITVKSVAMNGAVVNIDAYGTSTMTEAITLKWMAIGDV